MRKPAPYHFIPVEPTLTVFGPPALHDRLNLDARHAAGELLWVASGARGEPRSRAG